MFRLETLLEIIVADMRERAEFSHEDELDLVVRCFDLSLLPNKKVKEKYLQYKTMNGDGSFCKALLKSGPSKGKICAKKVLEGKPVCKTHEAAWQREQIREAHAAEEQKPEQQPQPIAHVKTPDVVEEEKTPPRKTMIHTVTQEDIVIKPNKFRNFVYPGTSLILDKRDKRITAREGNEGEWLPLLPDDIRTCKAMKLKYKVIDLDFQGEK